jgi:hypothetical protein
MKAARHFLWTVSRRQRMYTLGRPRHILTMLWTSRRYQSCRASFGLSMLKEHHISVDLSTSTGSDKTYQ